MNPSNPACLSCDLQEICKPPITVICTHNKSDNEKE
nr:MAG TPA: protein of unknown function DUF83 [Caudoviricetes sp.]